VANDIRVEDLLRQLAPEALGAVVRRYGSFDLAEDAVQEALVAASLQWPRRVSRRCWFGSTGARTAS
jgi:predicted RNA polymerase sigma factor